MEACPLRKTHSSSQDFVVNRLFMKLFKTSNIDIVSYCRTEFQFDLLCALFSNNDVGNYLRNIVGVTMSIVSSLIYSRGLLSRTRTRTVIAYRAFKHSSVFAWNSLPTDIRNCDSLLAFRRRLKSFLFNSAFTP